MLGDITGNADDGMTKAVDALRTGLQQVPTGADAFLDTIEVDYYGTPTPVSKVATIVVVDPRLVTIKPWDSGLTDAIEKAIRDSDPGIDPINDGVLVRVSIPPLSEDRRRELMKMVNGEAEQARTSVRSLARQALGQIADAATNGQISADERTTGEGQITVLRDQHVRAIDELARAKDQEITAAV